MAYTPTDTPAPPEPKSAPETAGPTDALPSDAQAIHDHGNPAALDVPL